MCYVIVFMLQAESGWTECQLGLMHVSSIQRTILLFNQPCRLTPRGHPSVGSVGAVITGGGQC